MKELGLTQSDVAKSLGIDKSTTNLKINNKRPFNVTEAVGLSNLLKLETGEFGEYFFTRKLQNATR